MRKIYFLRHLNQPFLAEKFANDSLQYCSDSCFAFETFLRCLSLDSFYSDVLESQYFSKEVSEKNRVLKVLSVTGTFLKLV